MIAAMAMFATVACGDKEDNGGDTLPVDAPTATIAAAPASVGIAGAGAFNVTLSKAATEDVVITITNTTADFLTVAATEIKIATGATTGTAAFTGKAAGTAKVTFAATTVKVLTAEVSVTVTAVVVPPASLKEYCLPELPGFKAYARLDGATIGSVTLPAGVGNDYLDYATEGSHKVTIADATDIVIKFANIDSGAGDPYGVGVYIDWNNDGDFADEGELIGSKEFTAGANNAIQDQTITIATIPATAVFPTTMRILSTLTDGSLGNFIPADGCGYIESGTAYDVEVNK